jgi:hypothetical protein
MFRREKMKCGERCGAILDTQKKKKVFFGENSFKRPTPYNYKSFSVKRPGLLSARPLYTPKCILLNRTASSP